MRFAAPHDSPPAGIRLTNSTARPTTTIVANRGVSRWFRRKSTRAPERDDLDERQDLHAGRAPREIAEPEDGADRRSPRRSDRGPLPDAEVRLVRGIGTDVENAGQLHRTD